MRRVRYSVAVSADGYIAGPNGESDWIIMDPAIDFASFFSSIDTVLVGRRTFEFALGQGSGSMPGIQGIVFSRTLRPEDHPGVRIVSEDAGKMVADLRAQPGKDIWLMGGGGLFRSLLEAGQVDSIETAIIPVFLGAGIPLLPPPASPVRLALAGHKVYASGIVALEYTVQHGPAVKGRARKAARRHT